MGRFALVNPDSLFLLEQSFGADGAQHDPVTFTFELERITRAKMQFLAERLGDENAPRLIESDLRGHGGNHRSTHPSGGFRAT